MDLSASGKEQQTFMELLFSVRDQCGLTDEEIRNQVDMFMVAGSE